jgi:hypothetical protein
MEVIEFPIKHSYHIFKQFIILSLLKILNLKLPFSFQITNIELNNWIISACIRALCLKDLIFYDEKNHKNGELTMLEILVKKIFFG